MCFQPSRLDSNQYPLIKNQPHYHYATLRDYNLNGGQGWNRTIGVSYVADLQSAALAARPPTQIGSPNWTRTNNTLINSQVLYLLSYKGI